MVFYLHIQSYGCNLSSNDVEIESKKTGGVLLIQSATPHAYEHCSPLRGCKYRFSSRQATSVWQHAVTGASLSPIKVTFILWPIVLLKSILRIVSARF